MSHTPKYPILMVHGMGFRDFKCIGYWGRIPATLEALGCRVFFGEQDSNADISTNGRHLAARIDEILKETGAEKVNIIAHSKGGLDARYAISTLGMASKVASLTTVSTPHNGSKTIDKLLKIPQPLYRIVCFFVDVWYRVLGDKNPRTYDVIKSFSTESAKEFNAQNPDADGVYYQSYAFVMKRATSDMLVWLPNLVVGRIEGENDGLLPPAAVKWGEFRGIYRGAGNRGISHFDEIDIRRKHLSKTKGEGISDIVDFYIDTVSELANRGF